MYFKAVTVKKKDGSSFEGKIMVPDDDKPEEILKIYDEIRCYQLGFKEYWQKSVKKIRSGRTPKIKIDLSMVPPELLNMLKKHGLLKK